jgi:hypothetical protein
MKHRRQTIGTQIIGPIGKSRYAGGEPALLPVHTIIAIFALPAMQSGAMLPRNAFAQKQSEDDSPAQETHLLLEIYE